MRRFPKWGIFFLMTFSLARAGTVYVAQTGDDRAAGTAEAPFATISRARDYLRSSGRLGHERMDVAIAAGTYRLPEPLVFLPEDSGTEQSPVEYHPYGGDVALSGSSILALEWQPYRDGIFVATVPAGTTTDQLFVNGGPMRLARYPNYDPNAQYLGGGSADALSPERVKKWSHPAGGIIHALDKNFWGDFHYVITGAKSDGSLVYEGGWQTNRPVGMHPEHRYVENIFEELDAPGEWFLDSAAAKLYFYPPAKLDLSKAKIEIIRLENLVEFRGSAEHPVRFITLRSLSFKRTQHTFMKTREPLMRSDWAIYRGGAVLFHGAEDCALEHCRLERVGGNAVFVDGYNRRIKIRDSLIYGSGASGVLFVGDPASVRSPLYNYSQTHRFAELDLVPGPKSELFPSDCLVEDCLIRDIGQEEKQATGVEIEIARRISIVHCSIYDTPRAGINIGDGCFGGNVIDGCDVFDTVRETGDHGSFNAWGRDRYWRLQDAPTGLAALQVALLDALEPNVIEHSRWRCDNGWDIDLDDGSSHYEIHDNLLLHGGLKLREGYKRTVTNNVIVNNSLHPHVWFAESGDVFTHNIVMGRYRPALMKIAQWGEKVDDNFFASNEADRLAFGADGCDLHSLAGTAQFIDPARGDFRVAPDSPALAIGFQNFAMDQFGVRTEWLRKQARTPEIPRLRSPESLAIQAVFKWEGAEIRNLGPGEFSAVGVAESARGVLFTDVPPYVDAAHQGFRTDDVLESINGVAIREVADFTRLVTGLAGDGTIAVRVRRGQADLTLQVHGPLSGVKASR